MSIINRLSQAESKLADIIWDRAPLSSPELVKLAEGELGWKRTTTYTVLKRMCDKGVVRNENAMVSARLTRAEYFVGQSRGFVTDTFGGSLPLFLTAFMGGGKLTPEQAGELRTFIEEHEESDTNG